MEEQKKPVSSQNNQKPEVLLSVFFSILCVFIAVLIVVLSLRAYAPTAEEQPTDTESDTQSVNPPAGPHSVPVFSGGVLPTKPNRTNNSQTISESIYSKYAILVNAETGSIVASCNDDKPFAPASMTKVMTLIVMCEQLSEEDLDKRLILTQEITDYVTSGEYEGMEISLIDKDKYLNDEFLIRDLLFGVGMASAADCTYMIAKYISGSEDAFVELMNQKAVELELENTHFDNIIGYASEQNYTTASDMAVIMMYAMQSEMIRDILCRTDVYRFTAYYQEDGVEKSYPRQYSSTIKQRLDAYKSKFGSFSLSTANLLGGKTGYLFDETTETKNHCLAAYASAKGQKYILILGGSEKTQEYTMVDVKTIFDNYIS